TLLKQGEKGINGGVQQGVEEKAHVIRPQTRLGVLDALPDGTENVVGGVLKSDKRVAPEEATGLSADQAPSHLLDRANDQEKSTGIVAGTRVVFQFRPLSGQDVLDGQRM